MISIVIPTFNEIKNGYLEKILSPLSDKSKYDVICVDSNSTDGTQELIKRFDARLIITEATTRAERINIGVECSLGEVIVINHPRSVLESNAFEFLIKNSKDITWGGFTHQFDRAHPLLAFTSWYSNIIRGDFRSIFYLDHCFYIHKDIAKEVFPIPLAPIFEDTILSNKLKSIAHGKRLGFKSITSSMRFNKNGVLKQLYLNQKMKLMYYLNKDSEQMNKEYENGVNLNNEYNS